MNYKIICFLFTVIVCNGNEIGFDLKLEKTYITYTKKEDSLVWVNVVNKTDKLIKILKFQTNCTCIQDESGFEKPTILPNSSRPVHLKLENNVIGGKTVPLIIKYNLNNVDYIQHLGLDIDIVYSAQLSEKLRNKINLNSSDNITISTNIANIKEFNVYPDLEFVKFAFEKQKDNTSNLSFNIDNDKIFKGKNIYNVELNSLSDDVKYSPLPIKLTSNVKGDYSIENNNFLHDFDDGGSIELNVAASAKSETNVKIYSLDHSYKKVKLIQESLLTYDDDFRAQILLDVRALVRDMKTQNIVEPVVLEFEFDNGLTKESHLVNGLIYR